ncbi:metalloregulator ArsR/SmtB family transcription factor [Chromobacterium sp. IIBBL 290-4]|uniref:ArsR/SmtB family transcription factor n=1 Tax=Chromobacterium sp. IIBBL 290-4 TaxID=2953890 RepID=UPI0020B64251|nr:metalloregulator ArsR/SmtB family transcription factor [Chromobacterium sp. IIBBL 290-4]UTH76365.1 metalloregulator ArsR/SmtB family transcription factor [Chromobacterium sp. IIBBL 290-4]
MPIENLAAMAELARALGNTHRLLLLQALAEGERAVEPLAVRCGLSVANASQHLQQLKRGGLAASRREGKQMLYRLDAPQVADMLAALECCAAHQRSRLGALLKGEAAPGLESLSAAELLQRLAQGEAALLDVRPEEEYAEGHLPGARNIPLDELERRLAELPAGTEVIAYCRGPYCVLSVNAVALLRARGMRARRLSGGFEGWRDAGGALE